MRANTDRSLATSFDAVATMYHDVRPRFDAGLVRELLLTAGVSDPTAASVLEIGAGTGQLTDALLAAGCDVTAIEPGPSMAALLDPRAHVTVTTFEQSTFDDASFDLIASANAFHWVDPMLGHPLAARLLKPGGSLLLIWNFPLPVDTAAQETINEVVADPMPDAVIDRGDVIDAVEQTLLDGRSELAATGVLTPREWGWHTDVIELSVVERLRLSASYASSVGVGDAVIDGLALEIERRGVPRCVLENRIHWLVVDRTA